MIKGVNRQVIEVSDTGSRYFERAILIVRPEFLSENVDRLKSDARRVLESIGCPPGTGKKPNSRKRGVLKPAAKRWLCAAVLATLLVLALVIMKLA